MSAIMEKLSTCYYLEEQILSRRNLFFTVLSSSLFTIAWWLVFDSSATDNQLTFFHYIWGILATVGFIMVNTVSDEQFNPVAYDGGCLSGNGIKAWLIIGFGLGFVSVIASVWILLTDLKDKVAVGGVQFLLQNIFILMANLFYKFGRDGMSGSSLNERF